MHIRLKTLLLLVSPLLLLVAAAYIQWGTVGLPPVPPSPALTPETAAEPYGFPAWLRITHYVNFLFLILLIRSGLQILMDHPRLYWNVHCTPGTEWLRLTPVEVPKDRVWTAKDDSRHLSPWIGLPGYRHTVGMARHWHFLSVLFWVGNGLVFVVLLFGTGQWQRLVPTSWRIVPDAWAVFVHYATFHLPPEPNGFYHYNALQQLAYFGVVFVLAPLAILTGPSMSPAFTTRFTWYPKLPGNRQIGRSLHFLVMCAFVVFIIGARDHGGAHRVRPEHEPHRGGHGRRQPDRPVPRPGGDRRGRPAECARQLGGVETPPSRPARRQGDRHARSWGSFSTAPPRVAEFGREDISPFFWANGKMPTSRRVEDAGRRRFQGLPAQGVRSGGEPGRAVAGRPPGDGQEDPDHAAPLHPGLVGHRRVGRAAAGGADQAGPAEARRARRSSSTRLARASSSNGSRAASTTTASRSRTLCTRRHCWPTR